MAGKAVLSCRSNSHAFQERTLILDKPVKIGRAISRARVSPDNAIFDCKVLSRNHALLWFSNGKFYLQDSKSSNGTFVNNQRLSKSGEESPPRVVYSGDVVQFGVDVLDNSCKVTHGCIVADLKLFLPDGKEAKPSQSALAPACPLNLEDLYALNQYMQEAIQREQMLESKLNTLRGVLDGIKSASEHGWKSLISEDKLLSRLEILENQLMMYSKDCNEEKLVKLRDELKQLQEDKSSYQRTGKDLLKKVLEEKMEAVQKCREVKRSLNNVEQEYSNLCVQMVKSHNDIQELTQKLNQQLAKNEEMEGKLKAIEEKHSETVGKLTDRNLELEGIIEKQHATEVSLERQVTELEVAKILNKNKILTESSESQDVIDKQLIPEFRIQIKNNDEDDDLKLNSTVIENNKTIEMIDLLNAQAELLKSEKLKKLQQINNHADDDEFLKTIINEDKLSEMFLCQKKLSGLAEISQLLEENGGLFSKTEEETKIKEKEEKEEKSVVDDNKLQHELDEAKMECGRLEGLVGSLQSQIMELKEEVRAVQAERERLEARLVVNSRDVALGTEPDPRDNLLDGLQARIAQLQHQLVLVGSRYSESVEQRVFLSQRLATLNTDYNNIVQCKYFNFIFTLPCIILFVAIVLTFHSTIAPLTATSELPDDL